jgi:hypothetical protein
MRERFDIVLSDEQERDLVRMIQEGKARMVEVQSNRITVWEVPLPFGQHQIVHAVFDNKRKSIVTVLCPEGSKT